ncbi:carbonic anhydrase [Vibrio sp. B1FLJ16]|uniref:carbonic anhydrase n=1 Tax=Vibrio sp. B1FLJ16 TaxID=2751178 RepID=UPI0015F5DBE2|nr:carbonic anhydrase [Vibrio sp. B1FLJ16]MCA0934359.1 carbonic anhydrase [Vibrio alginolyticus]CAD7816950.1 carbonic anhydrase [Vibrio sp. B1FLJ16]CAE6929702.1 carbonic anhydrase [Vibrio sp. B1FLJ16]
MNKSLAAIGLSLAMFGSAHAANWGYEGNHGPEHWGEFASECALGKNQSPINIQSATQAELAKLQLDYKGKVVALTNNGHTLQTSLEGENSLLVDGKQFTLKQFHFHTPSENHVDGKSYPLEAHYVHADEQGNLAVVAVFFEQGDANPALASLLENVPEKDNNVTIRAPFDASALIPADKDYYRFNGSLTTPPCSEGVRWLVIQEPQTISATQIEKFEKAMGENNRPVQPLNARMILSK